MVVGLDRRGRDLVAAVGTGLAVLLSDCGDLVPVVSEHGLDGAGRARVTEVLDVVIHTCERGGHVELHSDDAAEDRVFQSVVGGVAGSTGEGSGIFRNCCGIFVDGVWGFSRGSRWDSWEVGFEIGGFGTWEVGGYRRSQFVGR